MSDIKQQNVLDAAQAQFLRYGFRRVTMADIASGASISRPALYLLFDNKEAIFNGVYARYVDQALSEIEGEIENLADIAAKLSFAAEVWIVRPYELLHDTPEGRELTECSYEFTAELVDASYRRFETIIETALSQSSSGSNSRAMTPAALAQVFALSLRGIKAGAQNVEHLRILIADLITVTASTLEDAHS